MTKLGQGFPIQCVCNEGSQTTKPLGSQIDPAYKRQRLVIASLMGEICSFVHVVKTAGENRMVVNDVVLDAGRMNKKDDNEEGKGKLMFLTGRKMRRILLCAKHMRPTS